MASKWTTNKALTALNNARADVAKRRDDEDFTYEPWAVPDAEQQANEAEEINQRYAQLQQNGPSAAVLAGRQTMSDYNAALKTAQEAAQASRENEQRMLQNALTVGSLDSYKAYKNATAEQQAALQDIYSAQNTIPTGFERATGRAKNVSKMADQFKTTYGVDDDAYNSLMEGYNTYRQSKSKLASDSYSTLTDSQKDLLDEIAESQSSKQGSAAYRAQSKINQLKQETAADDDTLNMWQSLRNDEKNVRVSASNASRISADAINGLSGEARTALDNYIKGYQQSQKAAGSGSFFENLKGQLTNPLSQTKAISEGGQLMENARQQLKALGYSDSDVKKYEEYAQVYAEDSLMQEDKESAKKHPLTSNVNAILTDATLGMANGIAQFGADIGDMARYNTEKSLHGSAAKANTSPNNFGAGHGGGARAARYASTVQEATQNVITKDNGEDATLIQKVGNELYKMGYSAAQSHLTNIVGALGSAALGSSIAGELVSLIPAFGNTYYQGKMNAEERGLSNDKAFHTAFAEARHEVETEVLSDRMLGLIFKEDTVKNVLKETLKGAAEEGGEEVANNILNAITDRVINGDKSELNQSVQNYMSQGSTQQEAVVQTATDFIRDSAYSFLTAAGSTIIGMAPNAAARAIDNRVAGNSVFGSNTAQDYRDLQESYDLDEGKASYPQVKKAYDLAGKYAEKLENGGKVTTSERAKLWDATNGIGAIEQAVAENAERDEKRARIKNNIKGIFSNKTENAAAVHTAEQNNETTTDSAQESISDVSNVPEEYRSEKNNTSYNDAYKAIQSATTQDELNEAMQTAKNSEEISWEDYEKLEQTAGSYAASKNNLDLEQAKISTEDAYTAGYSGQEIGAVSPALQIAYNDGVQQAASDRAEQKAMNEEAVQKAAAKQHNDGLRTIIESNYQDGMNASTYNAVMASAINAGRTGMTFEDYAQENGASLAVVGEDIAKTAFKAGQKAAISDALKEAARSLGEKTNVKSYGIGSYTDARTDNKESINGEGVFKAVAQMTGLNIVLADNGFGDRDNGYYQASNSTIYINTNQADRMASTLFHEVGEFASVWNQKEYASVVNDIMQVSQKALGSREFNRLRQKYANAYQGETNKTDADIDKEMANDLLYQFLGNEQGMSKLMDQIDQNHGYKEAKSIKQRLADWIGRMVDSIKNFLSELQPNSYQRKMAEATLQNYEALQDSIVKSIANAEKNYSDAKAAAAETRAIEQGKGSIEDYGVENESSGEKRLSIETYEHGGREYLENFLENTDDLTEEQKDDILDHMEWAYNLAKDLAKSSQYEYFGQWSQTALAKSKDGVPLIEVRTASDSKPIRSVAVNNGEYPLNIDFSQVCKKRSTLNAVLNYMVKNYGMNLRTLTASDVININQAIKNHGFEIACGLCFVDAKRYRTGAWASTFTEGTRNKKGELNANQPGYNNLVRMIRPKDGSDVGYSYFNFATSIPTESARTIDQLSDDELDLSRLQRKIGRYAKYDENGNLIGIGGYKDNAGKTKNPTETIRLAWAIYSNPEMRHLISEEDLIFSDGLDAMRDQNSMLYSLVNAHWGAGKPKLSHGGTAYGNEILRSTEWGSKNDFNPESAAKVGGVRVQSFSDYEANMFFDYMQLFADMSARQLTSHGYTKEPYYAKLFGMTGQKINLSVVAKAAELTAEQQARYEKLVNKSDKALMEDPEFKEIAEHAGLGKDENGNWTRLLVEDETFPLQEALDLQKDSRYNSNCGIIWIGISDAQIRVLLDSNDVPMVIPYHSSGVSRIVKKARNLLLYTDYTNKQNTRTKDGKKITGKDFDFYGSLAKTNDVITTTNEYLAWCKEHDYLPKFDQFADHPNYYKLLIDFRAYDYNGIDPEKMANRVYQPQQKITMNFPENFSDLVAASLAEQQATKDLEAKEFTDAQGSLLNDVKDVLGLNDDGSRAAGESVRRSLVVDDGVNMDDIDDFVDTVMANNGQSGRKYNQVTIKELSKTDVENIRKATGGRVDASGKHFALEGSKLFHEIRRHSDPSNNWYSWQLTYNQTNVPDIVETMLHPDIVEDLRNVYADDPRENLAFVKERNGSYIAVIAIGGKRNKSITPAMILRFKTEELKKRLRGKTVAEFLYEEASKNLSDGDLDSIKKNRVTAESHESFDPLSLTSETILRSPLFEKNVAQDRTTDKRKSLNIDSDDNALTESQQKYFENSKVRDDDGRLKVMYHGSTSAGFTVFDPQYSDDGISLFFTDSPDVAESYSDSNDEYHPDKFSSDDRKPGNYKVYLNIENPYVVDANGKAWDELRDPYYDYYAGHEYETLTVSHDSKTGTYSMTGTKTSGIGETVIDSMTLDEVEKKYGSNLRSFLEGSDYYGRYGTSMESARYSDISFDGEWKEIEDHLRTRDIAAYAEKNGYDGVIFKNIVDIGEFSNIEEPSTVAIAFNSNQVKSVDNENPTFLADIRRATGIDETWDDGFDWSAEGEQIQSGLADALKSGNEILKGATVNEANIRRIARQLKDQYSSRISVDELADTLTKVFAYAQNQDYINYNDLATVISEVASPMIEQSTVKTGAQEFKDFRQALQSYTFNLDERQQKEVISAFGSWGAFRKALPGIKFTRDGSGVSLDGVWGSLCRESGYVLSRDVTSNDMPLELVDAYNAMKPTYENAFGEDAMNATQDAAMEIVSKYYQYEAQQEKNALKKKQKEDLENLSKKIAQTNAEMRKNLQQKYNERLEKELAKVKKENKPEKVSVQVARLRARNAKTVASLRESQKRKEQLRRLNKNAARLVDWVTDPTDKNHIPSLLQTPVMELVSAIDFVPQTVQETADGKYSIRILESRHVNDDGSYSYKWRTIKADTVQEAVAQYKKAMTDFGLGSASNRRWQDSMEAIHDLYQQDESDDWYERSELKQGLDKNLGEQLGEILRNNKGMLSIAELSSDELQTINDVIMNVMHAVRQVNRMYSQPSQQVSDVAHMVMDRASSGEVKGRKAHGKRMTGLVDTFTLDHAAPVTYFHGFFGTEEIDPITKTMIKAQNQKARDIRQAQEYMEGVKERANVDENTLKKWMYDAASSDHNTRNFYGLELTPTQVMSLYELMKRPDAQQHKVGGFVADEAGRKSNGVTTIVHLTDEQIKSITDTLSDEQKAFADAMQHYLANECAKQGNETAMQLYGYEKYLDENYFPMSTEKNAIATRDSNVTTGAINAIKNSGFTKKITPNATNALVLKDIFTVFSDHVSEMATYHSWAAPLQDMIRFFNYNDRTVDANGFVTRNSVKNAIDYFYGKGGQEYFTKLLSSINAREKSNFVGGKLYEALTGNAKAAAVMGNLRVVIQQPTAFMRAGEMIQYKYLKDGLEFKYAKEAAELRDRTSDVFWLKNQGNIDGYITQGMVSTITGIQTFKESVNEKAGWLAGKADEVTWAAMYRAVYAEQVDKLGKKKVGTKEFEDAVNERFAEIMLRTQVYDGTITRSQFMRSPEMANKMASAFMAEPVKTYNIVLWHMIDLMQASNETAKKKAIKGLAWAAYVLTLTNAANAVAQSIWDAFRNAGDPDSEDENFLQRFLDALGFGAPEDEDDDTFWDAVKRFIGGNFVDNMDLLSNIPLVADYWESVKNGIAEAFMGESSYSSDSDLSMAGITHFFKAIKAFVNPSDTMTNYGKFAAAARAFSDLTGYPVYAIQRDAVAIYNTMIGKTFENAPLLQKNTKYSAKQQAKLDVYTEAMNSGDFKQAIEDAYNAGNSYESIRNSIKDKCKDEYLALKESNPSEATQMKNRLAQMYVYLANKTGTYKDKTDAEKLKKYTENIEKWGESEEDETEE